MTARATRGWRRAGFARRVGSRVGAALLVAAGAAWPLAGQAPAGPAGTVEVELSVHGGRLVVPVRTADGAELSFLLTTGSPTTVLSGSTAERVGRGGALSLGGVAVATEDARTVPDAELTVEGRLFDGVVGPSTLAAFDVLVDAPGGRLVLRAPGRPAEWRGTALSEPTRLRVYHGVVLALDVQVNGRSFPAMLDLGTPGVLVNDGLIREAGVVGGRARTLRVGGATLTDVPVTVSDHPVIGRFSPSGAGFVLLGTPAVIDCPVALSWARAELRTCVR